MHTLVTNDDGVTAPGILALANAMRDFGQVTILGPEKDWSGGGHVKTIHRPLRITAVKLADGSPAYAGDGAPSDCVALALLGFVEEPIDLVVSGINPYGNMGHDVTYSGTVTAAMEAVIAGVPGIAFSLAGNENQPRFYYETAAIAARAVVAAAVEQGLTAGTLLNVNVPNLPAGEIAGIQVTRLGLRVYNAVLDRRRDPRGKPYYWIGGSVPSGVPDAGTDIGAVAEAYVSVTPLSLDLTDYRRAQEMSQWPWAKPELHMGNGRP